MCDMTNPGPVGAGGLDECVFAIRELVDALEGMIAYSRAATLDEADGEIEAYERAKAVVARHKRAS